MNDDFQKPKTPFVAPGNLPIDSKADVVTGVLIVLFCILGIMIADLFVWFAVVLGFVMIYSGLTGKRLMSIAVRNFSRKRV
jgi:hypothetical protein